MKYMSLLEVYEVYVVTGGRISLCLSLLESKTGQCHVGSVINGDI